MTEMLDELEYVRRVGLQPDDTLVIKAKRRITREQADLLAAEVKAVFGDHKVLVLPPDFDLTVAGPDEEAP